MPRSQVTITLGRSGQRVVKESRGDSAGGRGNGPWFPENERSFSESFGRSTDYSDDGNKRIRGEVNSMSYVPSRHRNDEDSGLSSRDLRLKLKRKRASEMDNSGYRRDVQHEEGSRYIRSQESQGDNLWKREPSSIRLSGPPREHSMPRSYSCWPASGARARSPENNARYSERMSNLRGASDFLPEPPLARPVDTSGTRHLPLKPPIPSASRIPMEPERHFREASSASNSMLRPPPLENQPITVGSFLHSLGLEKYAINFQAEEIDMTTLKQMQDIDLKQLSIPMGPRKKILNTLQGPGRRLALPLLNNSIR